MTTPDFPASPASSQPASGLPETPVDPVNIYHRTIFTRLLGPCGLLLSLTALVSHVAGGSFSPGFAFFWLAVLIGSGVYTTGAWTDYFQLDETRLIYHSPHVRLLGRSVSRVFDLPACRISLHGRYTSRVLRVQDDKGRIFIEGIEAFDEFVRRVEAVSGKTLLPRKKID